MEIEIPPDTLAEEAEVDLLEPGDYRRPAAPQQQVEEAARILAGAGNPLIWAGGGVIRGSASEALTRVAEHLQAPVMTSQEGKGAISERHYLSVGALKTREDPLIPWLATHDVILAVGTRFLATHPAAHQQVVQIDIDDDEVGRNFANTFAVHGDARLTLEALYASLAAAESARPSREAELTRLREQRFGPALRLEPQDSLLAAVRSAMPDNGILVAGITQLGYYSRVFYPVYEPATYLTSSYFGNLGYAYPLALGAKVARPDRPVVALSGDGGFLYNSQELATAVQHGINAVVVVFNDNAYGNVLRDQKTRFNGRTLGSELHNPDFVRLAEAYGARGVRAEGADALGTALREALAIEAPTLIEVPVGPMPNPH